MLTIKTKSIKVKCKAKINLAIDVIGKRPDGYHDVRMVMQQVDIWDTILISLRDDGKIKLTCDKKELVCDETNLAYRAAKAYFEAIELNSGCDIFIEKRIPMGAGMAGGSADAAGVIKGLNTIFSDKLSLDKMLEIGGRLGADVPFCIMGGCVLAEGIGTILTPLPDPPKVYYVIAKPRQSVSTKWVYEHLDFTNKPKNLNIDKLVEAIQSEDLKSMYENMGNVLENATIPICPDVKLYKDKFIELGSGLSMMSGSGSAVFGMFEDKTAARWAYDKFLESYPTSEVWLV